jgi:predicted amidohydrolase
MRIALATLPFAGSVQGAVAKVQDALMAAANEGARIMCTPENYVPGLRGVGLPVEPATVEQLSEAHATIGEVVRETGVALVLGTELPSERGVLMSALVYDTDGTIIGRQDKVQLDPSENVTFVEGVGRSVFEVAGLRFGICICHEGWRYPETVRWPARRGAQLVFHPHMSFPPPSGERPRHWADERNSFHEKAALCRAAENSIYFATVNYAMPVSETTSAVIGPDGSMLAHQPYGKAGLLVVDIDPDLATGLLASRYRPGDHEASPTPHPFAPVSHHS